MKRDDLFPSKYLKCADLKGRPHVLQIKQAPIETLKNQSGQEQRKVVLHFHNLQKALPLNMTNFDTVANITGTDETDGWPVAHVELYPATTTLGGKTVECIRIRKPPQEALPLATPSLAAEAASELDDSIPW